MRRSSDDIFDRKKYLEEEIKIVKKFLEAGGTIDLTHIKSGRFGNVVIDGEEFNLLCPRGGEEKIELIRAILSTYDSYLHEKLEQAIKIQSRSTRRNHVWVVKCSDYEVVQVDISNCGGGIFEYENGVEGVARLMGTA